MWLTINHLLVAITRDLEPKAKSKQLREPKNGLASRSEPRNGRSASEIYLIEPPFIGNFEGKVFHLGNVG